MTQAEMESVKLEQIASEYRGKGYQVHVRPDAAKLPAFLSSFHPDLVATSSDDNVVVEIKSSFELVIDPVIPLAETVQSQHGWRLEVIVLNPPAAHEVPQHGDLVSDDRIVSLLQEAQDLTQERRYEAAAVVAWAAAEATFRRLVRGAGQSDRRSSDAVLKQLYAAGLIDADQYEVFSRAMDFRNAFAHGFSAAIAPETIQRFIRDVEELTSLPAA
jgi:uncharacterized protein YutE (UPF0331/DUF86 family)